MSICIKSDIFNRIVSLKKRETCGVIVGRNGIYEKIYLTENSARNKKRCFKISIFERIKIFLDMIRDKFNEYIIFHVHIYDKQPSSEDIINFKNKMIIIIFKNFVYLYKIDNGFENLQYTVLKE